MFRFTIRELMLVILVVALGLGWWVEHRGKTKAAEEVVFQQWKNRVLEVILVANGYEIKTEGKSITLNCEGGTTRTYTPTSLVFTDGYGTTIREDYSDRKQPSGEPYPEYHFPQPRSSPPTER